MTPSQLLPPVKPSEAVVLADLIFRITQGRPWSSDLRGRLASSLPTIRLESITPFPQTFAPDPAHASTFFILVHSRSGDSPGYWLLHMAPASAATTPLFPSPILLARVRPAGEREIVVNAIPYEENLAAIVNGLHPQLLARSTSVHNIYSKPLDADLAGFLKQFPKRSNLLPALRTTIPGWQVYAPLLLSNWRDGFVAILEKLREVPGTADAAPFSRFSVIADSPFDARSIAAFHSRLKSTVKKAFDFEIDVSEHAELEVEDLHMLLDNLKLLGVGVQSVELNPGLHIPAFATLLQARHIGITLQAQQPGEPISGLRTHWKLAS